MTPEEAKEIVKEWYEARVAAAEEYGGVRVPASFWINLDAEYKALLEFIEKAAK
jgi:hypothetical protein